MGRPGGGPGRRAPSGRWLRRERLHLLLADASDVRLTLLLAPAGAGKSVLLRELTDDRRARGVPVTWVDGTDSMADPAEVRARLGPLVPDGPGGPDRTLLVIDDLHTIHGTAGERAVFELVGRLPMTTTVLAATRRAPAYDLSAWRVADDLIEIGFDDLRFMAREIHLLFAEALGAPMTADEVAIAVERTDGWIAALRLLESATRGRHPADRQRVLATPAPRWPALREYVRTNVLAGLDDESRHVLVHGSALGRLTESRVDDLLDRRGTGPVLADLHARRLLVDDLLSDAYRLPRWLAVHLDAERAGTLGPTGERTWLARAGELLLREGEVAQAARCFAEANLNQDLARLLDGSAGDRLAAGPGAWLRSLPISLEGHHRVAQARARQRLAAGDLAGAAAFYRRAEAAGAPAADAIRAERMAVEVWLDPEPPDAPAGPPDREDWSAALRRATHAEPRLVAARLLRRAGAAPAERLAGSLAGLLAGDVDESRRLLSQLTREAKGHPAVPVIARLVRMLLDTFAFPTHEAGVELEMVIADAERLDLPGLAALASVVVDLLNASPLEAARLVDDRDRAGDRWGAMLVAVIGGLLSARFDRADGRGDGSGPTALDLLDDAIGRARQLAAGVVEAWARAASAVVSARAGSPEA
ncbi:MAG: hypothetical protein ACRD0A_04535, partial [Acidimicrobiales bacterium]